MDLEACQESELLLKVLNERLVLSTIAESDSHCNFGLYHAYLSVIDFDYLEVL